MASVFILSGESGAYSDTMLWTVGVYASEDLAKAKLAALESILKAHGLIPFPENYRSDWDGHFDRCSAAEDELQEIDPMARVQVSGTAYEINEHVLTEVA